MKILQISKVGLRNEAKDLMTVNQYERAQNWLTQWTCQNNFQALVYIPSEMNEAEVFKQLRKEVVDAVSHHGYPEAAFYFEVSIQQATDNRFWMGATASIRKFNLEEE
jgi:chromosomal replication initiation ATPase DnaA